MDFETPNKEIINNQNNMNPINPDVPQVQQPKNAFDHALKLAGNLSQTLKEMGKTFEKHLGDLVNQYKNQAISQEELFEIIKTGFQDKNLNLAETMSVIENVNKMENILNEDQVLAIRSIAGDTAAKQQEEMAEKDEQMINGKLLEANKISPEVREKIKDLVTSVEFTSKMLGSDEQILMTDELIKMAEKATLVENKNNEEISKMLEDHIKKFKQAV